MKIKLFITMILVAIVTLGSSIPVCAQTKRALLVGISEYQTPGSHDNRLWKNISGAKDVELMIPVLMKQGFKNPTTLTDSEATKQNIISSLKALASRCKSGDIVYIHFSMHGQMIEDKNGDEGDGWDEALCPYDSQPKYRKGKYEGQNHLLDDELEPLISQIRNQVGKNGMVYVAMDSCHSGGSLRGDEDGLDEETETGLVRGGAPGFSSSVEKAAKAYKENIYKSKNMPRKANQAPVYYIEACQPDQVNKEYYRITPELHCGSLTYAMITTLNSGSMIDKKGEWTSGILTQMKKMKRNGNSRNTQVPMIEISK